MITDERYTASTESAGSLPPVPSYVTYFHVEGVADDDVAKVLTSLLERRIVARARHAARGKKQLAKPGWAGVVLVTLLGAVAGYALGRLLGQATLMAVGGAIVGLLVSAVYRQRVVSAYTGLALLHGAPAERVHPNYWLPVAIRHLCSPRGGIFFDA